MKTNFFTVSNKVNPIYIFDIVMATGIFVAEDAPMELIIDPSADNEITQTLEREMGIVPRLLIVTKNGNRELKKVYRFSFDHPKAHLLPMYEQAMKGREKIVGKTVSDNNHDVILIADEE